ncbi:MAG: DNA primase, partial [Microcella sp.]|nr:DNA primase [Microcella sp.]
VAPDGLDPCDLRLKRGDDAVRLLIQGRKPMYEFMVRRQLDALDLETVEGRVAALRATAPIVAGIRDESLSVGYTRTLAGWIGMDPAEVAQAVRAARHAPARGSSAASTGRQQPVPADGATGSAAIAAGDAVAAMAEAVVPTIGIAQLPTDPVTRLERELLMALLQHPDQIAIETAQRALQTSFTQPALATVRDAVFAAIDDYGTSEWVRRVADEAPPAFSPLVTQLAIAPLPMRDGRAAEYCAGVTTSLIERDLLRRKTELLGALQRTDAAADPERYRTLQQQLVEVEGERRKVRGD